MNVTDLPSPPPSLVENNTMNYMDEQDNSTELLTALQETNFFIEDDYVPASTSEHLTTGSDYAV